MSAFGYVQDNPKPRRRRRFVAITGVVDHVSMISDPMNCIRGCMVVNAALNFKGSWSISSRISGPWKTFGEATSSVLRATKGYAVKEVARDGPEQPFVTIYEVYNANPSF